MRAFGTHMSGKSPHSARQPPVWHSHEWQEPAKRGEAVVSGDQSIVEYHRWQETRDDTILDAIVYALYGSIAGADMKRGNERIRSQFAPPTEPSRTSWAPSRNAPSG